MHRDQIKAFPGNVDLHLEALAVLRGSSTLFEVVDLPESRDGDEMIVRNGSRGGERRRGRVARTAYAIGVAIEVVVSLSPMIAVCGMLVALSPREWLPTPAAALLLGIMTIFALAMIWSAADGMDRP